MWFVYRKNYYKCRKKSIRIWNEAQVDIEIISKLITFLLNGEKNTNLNVIKKVQIEVNQKLHGKVAYFCNERLMFWKISLQVAQYSNKLLNDHEEAEAKLVALPQSSECNITEKWLARYWEIYILLHCLCRLFWVVIFSLVLVIVMQ